MSSLTHIALLGLGSTESPKPVSPKSHHHRHFTDIDSRIESLKKYQYQERKRYIDDFVKRRWVNFIFGGPQTMKVAQDLAKDDFEKLFKQYSTGNSFWNHKVWVEKYEARNNYGPLQFLKKIELDDFSILLENIDDVLRRYKGELHIPVWRYIRAMVEMTYLRLVKAGILKYMMLPGAEKEKLQIDDINEEFNYLKYQAEANKTVSVDDYIPKIDDAGNIIKDKGATQAGFFSGDFLQSDWGKSALVFTGAGLILGATAYFINNSGKKTVKATL